MKGAILEVYSLVNKAQNEMGFSSTDSVVEQFLANVKNLSNSDIIVHKDSKVETICHESFTPDVDVVMTSQSNFLDNMSTSVFHVKVTSICSAATTSDLFLDVHAAQN